MQGNFFARRFTARACATTFARALWGSSFLHLAALTGLVVWAAAARQIPGGGGRGGMQLDLSTGDGAPNGLLPLQMLGDPNSPPEIKPWTKDTMPIEIAVVAPPQLIETPAPVGAKEKSSPAASDDMPPREPTTSSTTTAQIPAEIPPAEVHTAEMFPAPAVAKPPGKATQSDRNVVQSNRQQTGAKTDSQVQLTGTDQPSPTDGSSPSGVGSPSFVGNLPPRYPDVAVQNRWEGDVMLLLHIDTKGRVIKVEVLHGSGHTVLDDEAAAAIQHWVGQPAQRDGLPVESTAQLPVHFRLK